MTRYPASDRLRHRAQAFREDRSHVGRQINNYTGDTTDRKLAEMKERHRAYLVIAHELTNLAEELRREGM